MNIMYCNKYQKYVSLRHCEFFNEGSSGEHYDPAAWSSIKLLTEDNARPKRDISPILRPFKCRLISRKSLVRRANRITGRPCLPAG